MSEHPPSKSDEPAQETEFRLTGPWVLVGIVAVIVGLLCGLVMSTATFLK